MLDRNVAKRTKTSGDPAYVFKKLPVGWFDSFDYAVANLEGPVTDKRRPPEKSIDFQFDPSVIDVLKAQGFDAFSQANNHALDQGSIGYTDSVRRLREAGFLVFGHQVADDEIALATTTVNGIRFAFLGYNTTDNPLDREDAKRVIEEIRSQIDQIVVYMHWGAEYKDHPEASTKELAHWFVDQGVDVVIGGHPHWVQGMEMYKNKPIVYSLGNFIFDQYFSKETQEGLAVELEFGKNGVTVKPIPIRLDESQPRLVEGEELKTRLEALAKISF
jgi:poly-gamma-glutamate synthesis protein (capsule biosynthesis protein)